MKKPNAEVEEANAIIEKAIGELYRGFYHLRQLKEYQEEYDTMGTIINMLMEDRNRIRGAHTELKW